MQFVSFPPPRITLHEIMPNPDPRDIIDEVLGDSSRQSFRTKAEAERFVEARVRAYNATPQPELGGLSPAQTYALLYGDWSTTGALIVNTPDPNEIGDPDLLHNVRAFLATLRDEGPAKTTAGGNLSREFVGRMLPRLRWEPGYLERVRLGNKVIDERDVPPLETLRHLLQIAKLIFQRKGFHISRPGRALLDEARRGELLVLLFLTFFRALDLRSVDGSELDAGLQPTIAFSFWKIRSAAESWVSSAHLAEVAWLESAKDPLLPSHELDNLEFRAWRFRRRVVDPLVEFGLLESRDIPADTRTLRAVEVRKTALFDRVLRFQLDRPAK